MIALINVKSESVEISLFGENDSILGTKVFQNHEISKYQLALKKFGEYLKPFDLENVVVSYPGEVNPYTGLLIDSNAYSHWNGANLKNDLVRLLGVKIFIENDSVINSLSEISDKERVLNLFFATNSGIGGTLTLPFKDRFDLFPLEIGHFVVVLDGKKCICGQNGCLEAYSSLRSMVSKYETLENSMDPINIILASRYLTQAILSVCAIHEIDKVYYGGDFDQSGEKLIEKMFENVETMFDKRNKWFKKPSFEYKYNKESFIEGALNLIKLDEQIENVKYTK